MDDGDFVFLPGDLAEEVELSLEAKKRILYLHAHLRGFDHWQLLGVPWNAPVRQVRDAYLEQVKFFHPDRHAGRRLGSYLPRIEAIFRALTVARDALCDEARRAEYVRKTAPPEEVARMETRRLQDELRAGERRARLARSNAIVGHVQRVHQLVERGKRAMAEGGFAQARHDFLTAAALDRRHAEARTLADEAARREASERSQALYDSALRAQAIGDGRKAIAILRTLLEGDPQCVRAATTAARLSLDEGDLEAARAFAEQAVRAAPREALAYEILGAVLHAQGEGREARRVLERALSIDPDREGARALLKKLRWSFLP